MFLQSTPTIASAINNEQYIQSNSVCAVNLSNSV